MTDATIEVKRFQVQFGHIDGGKCDKLTSRTLDCEVVAGAPRVDISTWGDPGIKHCQHCGEPLTRVASYTPVN